MAILSFEELEEQIENETLEETTEGEETEVVPNSELQAEAIERSEETLNAVVNLDSLIAQHDEALKAIEENKKSIEDVKQLLQDSMVSTNHILKVLTNSPLKKLAEAKKQNITFESINNDPVSTLMSFNNMLKIVRSNVSQEDVEEVRRGWFEKLKTFFKSFQGEFEFYYKKSSAVIRLLTSNKDSFELNGEVILSPVNNVLITDLFLDTAENYKSFVNTYVDALKRQNQGVSLNFKSFKQIKGVTGDDDDLYPISLDVPTTSGQGKVKAYCIDKKLVRALENGANGNSDFIELGSKFEIVYVRAPKTNIKNIEDLITVAKHMHENMDKHFKDVDVTGRRWYLSSLEYNENNNRKTVHTRVDQGVVINEVTYHKVNEISAKIWGITRLHNIWGEIQTAQRELLTKIRVKDDVEYSLAKKLQADLELAIKGKLK